MGEIFIDIVIDSINQSQKLLDIMLEYQNSDGYCVITQKELADKLNRSQGLVSKLLRRLNRVDNCIELVSRGKYKVNNGNLLEKGPYVLVFKILNKLKDNPEIIKLPLKSQADIAGIALKDVEMAYGFIRNFQYD